MTAPMNVADIMVIVELCVDQVIRILTAATLPCANYLVHGVVWACFALLVLSVSFLAIFGAIWLVSRAANVVANIFGLVWVILYLVSRVVELALGLTEKFVTRLFLLAQRCSYFPETVEANFARRVCPRAARPKPKD